MGKTPHRRDYLDGQLEEAARLLGCHPETLLRCCIAEALPGFLDAPGMARVVSAFPCPDDGPLPWDSSFDREFAAMCDEREMSRARGADVEDLP